MPLPRPVGVESDDELLVLRMHRPATAEAFPLRSGASQGQVAETSDPYLATPELGESQTTNHESRIKNSLSSQLPQGCELISIEIAERGTSFEPCSATYIFAVRQEYLGRGLESRIKDLLSSDSLVVRRMTDKKKSKFRNMDVRGFIKSIELDKAQVNVQCIITSAGSIRIQEVLELLELDMEKLASPIRRTCVQWRDV